MHRTWDLSHGCLRVVALMKVLPAFVQVQRILRYLPVHWVTGVKRSCHCSYDSGAIAQTMIGGQNDWPLLLLFDLRSNQNSDTI